MKLKHIAAAAVMAVSGSAFATALAPTNLGTLGPAAVGVLGSTVTPFETIVLQDFYSFTLGGTSTVTGQIFSTGYGSTFVTLVDSALTVIGSSTTPNSFSFSNIAAGSYKLSFGGISSAVGAFYGGGVSAVAAPVPEPETYALMLAGLGVVGFMAARRRPS